MIKLMFSVAFVLGFVCLGAKSSDAQIVTSYYTGPAPVAPLTYSAYSPGQFLAAPTVAAVAPAYSVNRFGAPAYAAPVYAAPAYGAPVVGVVPVRRGLFGLRTAYVPVVAPTAYAVPAATVVAPIAAYPTVAAPYAAARPVMSSVPYYGTSGYPSPAQVFPPQAFPAQAYPAQIGPAQVAYPAATYAPNAVIQSGFRGTVPVSGYAAPLQYTPALTAPGISFYPGAVMSMQ